MKPTQEQVIAWAKDCGLMKKDAKYIGIRVERLINTVYEAGRKDENEACAQACEGAVGSASMYQDRDAAVFAYGIKNHRQKLIRARREQ